MSEGNERNQLAGDIARYLANPNPAPTAPAIPGVPADASQSVRDAAIQAIASKPSLLRTQDEAACLDAVQQGAMSALLLKPNSTVTAEEAAIIRAEALACMRRGW